MRRVLPLAVILLALSGVVYAGANLDHKIALHIVPHGTGCATLPVFSACDQIQTTYAATGDIDVIPVFFGLHEYTVVEFGLSWPPSWGSTDYTRCVGDISIGEIVKPGDGIATAWSECQRTWSVAHGFGWLSATSPGRITLVRDPPTGDFGVVDCAFSAGGPYYDYPAHTFDAGVGGTAGDDPCGQVSLALSLAKSDGLGGNCADSGSSLTYTITFGNTLNSSGVHNVILTDTLPSQIAFVSATLGGIYDELARSATWHLGTIAPSESGSVALVVRVGAGAGATIRNTCEIVSDETQPRQATTTTNVCASPYYPLRISMTDGTGGNCAYQGDNLTYTISFGNAPNSQAVHHVTLRDQLPTGTVFVSASGGGSYDVGSGTVTWAIAALAPAESGTRQLVVRITASPGSTITNACEVSSHETPPSGASKLTAVCASPVHPLNLTKTAILSAGCVEHGANLTYRIAYDNKANTSEAHNVVLTDHLPGQTDFVSASSGGTYDAGAQTVTWNLGTLAAGAADTQQVTIKVNVALGTSFTNVCDITGDGTPAREASCAVKVCGGSNRNAILKIAVHVKAHPTSCTKGYPTFTTCGQIKTTYAGCGDIDAVPVFYDLVEYSVTECGLRWPTDWGSCSFVRCKGDIAVGGISHPGDGIAIAWTTCQYGWSAAPGFGWLAASTSGEITVCPNPVTGDFGVVNCAPSPGPYYDYPIATARAGVCGALGDSPCYPTRLTPTTWGAVKSMFK